MLTGYATITITASIQTRSLKMQEENNEQDNSGNRIEDVGLSMNDLDNMLDSEVKKEEKTELDVLKELFTLKNIESKTELSVDQIILFNQKRTIAKILKWRRLKECLDDFLILSISKERAGRKEFIEGFKSERERQMGVERPGFLSRMFGGGGNQ